MSDEFTPSFYLPAEMRLAQEIAGRESERASAARMARGLSNAGRNGSPSAVGLWRTPEASVGTWPGGRRVGGGRAAQSFGEKTPISGDSSATVIAESPNQYSTLMIFMSLLLLSACTGARFRGSFGRHMCL